LCSVSLSSVSTSSTVIESWVSTFSGSLCLEQYAIYYSKLHWHSERCTNNPCTTAIYRSTVLLLSKIHPITGVHLQWNAEMVNNTEFWQIFCFIKWNTRNKSLQT
jgi:hypothetical protein